MQQLGQILVLVGIFIVVLGVAVAAVQTVIEAIKKREGAAAASVPGWPEKLGDILLELVKKGGGLAIAAVGLIVIYVGLQVMNSGTEENVEGTAPTAVAVWR